MSGSTQKLRLVTKKNLHILKAVSSLKASLFKVNKTRSLGHIAQVRVQSLVISDLRLETKGFLVRFQSLAMCRDKLSSVIVLVMSKFS